MEIDNELGCDDAAKNAHNNKLVQHSFRSKTQEHIYGYLYSYKNGPHGFCDRRWENAETTEHREVAYDKHIVSVFMNWCYRRW